MYTHNKYGLTCNFHNHRSSLAPFSYFDIILHVFSKYGVIPNQLLIRDETLQRVYIH